jgi:hypothetical protein
VTEAEARKAGFELEDFAEPPFEIWPDNAPAWRLFCQVSTQWRTSGMGAYIGLDYGPLFELMTRQGLQGQDWQDMFDDIQTLEAAALEQIRKNHEETP